MREITDFASQAKDAEVGSPKSGLPIKEETPLPFWLLVLFVLFVSFWGTWLFLEAIHP